MHRKSSLVLCLLLLGATAGATARQAEPAPVPASGATAPSDTDAAPDGAFAAYVDGLAAATLAREDLAGLVVSVVRDDRMLLARGYGMATFDPPRPVEPEATMFRIGSVAKTFTYTAAMQLVSEGRLALDDAVNDRLPPALAVPDDGWSEPIRIRHLLTHAAGFEDSALGHLFQRDASKVLAPEEYLLRHRPRRVRAPGTAAVYSNYGVALLGAVVAHVSGLPFVEYVELRITGPLDMRRATFREPLAAGDPRALDPALAAEIATGYRRRAGAFEPGPFEFISHGAAAGGMSATATDMARWMRMHLNAGVLDGVRVLPEAVALSMREVLFRNAPQAGGIAYGFLTQSFGPHQTWGHGGATLYFHSAMLMVPTQGIGVFVSSNTDNARGPVADFAHLVLQRLLVDDGDGGAAIDAAMRVEPTALARYEGTYRSNRRSYSTVEKLLLGPSGDATVATADDGTLRISVRGETTRWLPVAPDVFQDAESPVRLQFLAGPDGAPDRYVAGPGIAVMERVRVVDGMPLLLALGAGTLLVALGRLLPALRRTKRRPDPRPGLRRAKMLARFTGLAWLAFVALFAYGALSMAGEGSTALFTYPSTALRAALWLALVAALATALEVLALPAVWRSAWRGWPKLRHTGAVLVFVAATALLWRWQVLG